MLHTLLEATIVLACLLHAMQLMQSLESGGQVWLEVDSSL